MTKTRVAVHGACGRMGQRIVANVLADPATELVGAIEAANHPAIGRDIGPICGLSNTNVPVSNSLPDIVDGVIDFSIPEASLAIAKRCAHRRIPLLVATTGFSKKEREELIEYHHETALLVASNCSLVVNLLMKLAEQTAVTLKGRDFDVEIVERHHRFKADAPSGTALRFAEIIENAMGLSSRRHGREGITGERPRSEIGLHALRTGDNVGEHTIVFSTLGETLELVHKGHSRDSYAKGAVEAIKFLAAKRPGIYTMADVLGL